MPRNVNLHGTMAFPHGASAEVLWRSRRVTRVALHAACGAVPVSLLVALVGCASERGLAVCAGKPRSLPHLPGPRTVPLSESQSTVFPFASNGHPSPAQE